MNKISATIVADSVNKQGDRLTSLLITFPRILLSEINTHRMLSKNTSSSRAIPFKKMVEAVQNNPFIPIAWQKQHSGMQGTEYFENTKQLTEDWTTASKIALKEAKKLHDGAGITKQLTNRLLEPFMWTTMLITGSREGWNNFFELRNPVYEVGHNTFKSKKEVLDYYSDDPNFPELRRYSDLDWLKINKGQAEIHMMALAEEIYDAVNESTPKQLKAGEWHIPFEDKIHIDGIQGIQFTLKGGSTEYHEAKWTTEAKIKISTAMAAHTSYTIVGGEAVKSYEKWIELHDKLIAYDPPHSSPMEHCARAMSDEEHNRFYKGIFMDMSDTELENSYVPISVNGFGWCYNLKGFIPYRYMIDNNLIK